MRAFWLPALAAQMIIVAVFAMKPPKTLKKPNKYRSPKASNLQANEYISREESNNASEFGSGDQYDNEGDGFAAFNNPASFGNPTSSSSPNYESESSFGSSSSQNNNSSSQV